MRTLGQWTRKIRSMAAEFQNQFQEAMREAEMADLKKQVDDMAQRRQELRSAQGRARGCRSAWARMSRNRSLGPPSRTGRCERRRPRLRRTAAGTAAPPALTDRQRPNAEPPLSDAAPPPRRRRRDRSLSRPPPSRRAAERHRWRRMSREDEEKEIEATKAPLMDHLIELRSRLIKALAAFVVAMMVCFFFARQIYNVLTWPYRLGGRRGKFQIHLYRAARIFRRAAQARACSAAASSRFR